MINRRPLFFAVFIYIGMLPIPFPFLEQFERIEESPLPFGSNHLRLKFRIACNTDAVSHFRFEVLFFYTVKYGTKVRKFVRPHKAWRIDCNMLSIQWGRRFADFVHQCLLTWMHDALLRISVCRQQEREQ